MSAGTLHDTDAPPLEVRIYDHSLLLAREPCDREEDAAAVVARWADVANLFVVADHPSSQHGPDDVPASEELLVDGDDDHPLASAPVPAHGTE
jgi:hypothetical protein